MQPAARLQSGSKTQRTVTGKGPDLQYAQGAQHTADQGQELSLQESAYHLRLGMLQAELQYFLQQCILWCGIPFGILLCQRVNDFHAVSLLLLQARVAVLK